MKHEINNFDELLEFIENNDISMNDLNIILWNTIKVMIVTSTNRVEVLTNLKIYWEKYENSPKDSKPIFLDLEDPLARDKYFNDLIDSL